MKYISTRGGIQPISFSEAVMMGLAIDGGLTVPESIPDVRERLEQWRLLPYTDLAHEILALFVDEEIRDDLRALISRSYKTFHHPDIAPIVSVDGLFILELFHGPTLAFKDFALQLLGHLFEAILDRTQTSFNVLGATSGDTGSAAIHAIRGRKNMRIFILHPHRRVSRIQELQMTTVLDANVHNIAIEGSFDDGQKIIKELFNDLAFRDRHRLAAVNSVNWARIAAQIVYYFWGAVRLTAITGTTRVQICVPTGNFGNIFAGFLAQRMGAPISKLILATNQNAILSRFFRTGVYAQGELFETHSPSMDIQVASNFERYLYYLVGQDGARVRKFMQAFNEDGKITLDADVVDPATSIFSSGSCDNSQTLTTIKSVYDRTGYVLDPHTAVGVHVARTIATGNDPVLCLATAHPAKFPEAIEKAVGTNVAHHGAIDALSQLPTRCQVLPANAAAVRQFIEANAG